MTQRIDISFIIPSFNSSRTILNCICAIKISAGSAIDFEIIVADSSQDSTKKLIRENHEDVTIIELPEKTPPGIARNAGAKNALGDILVFIDSDCAVAPDYYEKLKETLPKYSIGGGSVLNGTLESKVGTAEYYLEFSSFMPSGSERKVGFCPTCNFFIKKETFNKLGGFSDARTAEDIEFGLAVRKSGDFITFIPQLKVTHNNRDEMERFLSNQFLLGRGSAFIRKKHQMSGSFLTRYRFLIPLLGFVRLKSITLRAAKAGGFPELGKLYKVMRELRRGLKSWILGFIEGANG